ncbi:tRNA (adenosine(37)-N6)-dimethylallyltransferase MiaA [Microbacterium sp. cf332]|uniref:tRNA (adenosine(37)-N6)-dimethylallyltransferase MiaA n=1 Tax=Microbacterium sp. cf332 TaxID=1761804 RepID=UPI00088D67D2|nr:tRNA (adenosine(37)-N6)-dimethylallyltransferase MiaA [Microbacterium sp. cf332]SDQ20784.1 tRNA dimethylallyltransferase [Microbacterium sp. cf332]
MSADTGSPSSAAPRLWAVVGATGTGKTGLSLDLASALEAHGRRAEIVNVDAMQLYRGMDIGTAKLAPAERRGIPHHLFDVLAVTDEAAVAWYQDVARRCIHQIHDRGADAILVGGSGLYASSVLFDFRFPPRDEALRARLEAELDSEGVGALFARLREADPVAAGRIDPRNGRRIVRALEMLAQGGATHGGALPEAPEAWLPSTRIIGTAIPRDELVPILDARVDDMWARGLVDEVAALRHEGIERAVTAGRAIGYAQALAQLRGDVTEGEAIAETQALTRRYARRQVSWFKRYADVTWVDAREADATSLVAAASAPDERAAGGSARPVPRGERP